MPIVLASAALNLCGLTLRRSTEPYLRGGVSWQTATKPLPLCKRLVVQLACTENVIVEYGRRKLFRVPFIPRLFCPFLHVMSLIQVLLKITLTNINVFMPSKITYEVLSLIHI